MAMMQTSAVVATLAWRYLWRNYRRTFIMLLAITVGVWAMIFMTAFMRGMVDDAIASGIRNLPGHAQIYHPQFRDDPNIVNSVKEPDAELLGLLSEPPVVAWTMRLKVPAIISSERDVRGVQLLAVTPASEAQLSFDIDSIVEGRWLEDENDTGVVIGQKLADKLETRLGKRIVLMSQDVHNGIGERGSRIVGIYRSELAAIEELNVYAGLETIQQMLDATGLVSEIAMVGNDYREPTVLSAHFAGYMASQPSEKAILKPWLEIDTYLGTMLGVMDGFLFIWVLVIFLALSFGLVNTLVMAVFERVREIGLMQALGMHPGMIVIQILFEAFLLLAIGLLLGNSLAVLTLLPLLDGVDVSAVSEGMEMFGVGSTLYPTLLVSDMVMASVIVIVLGLAASILPAWRAASYNPIIALNKT